MAILLTIIHVVVALFLIVVVLLQRGKRADLAGAFGGGGSQTAFGTRGAATVLSKATTVSAVVFMMTCLGLSVLSSRSVTSGGTVLDEVPAPGEQQAPLTPGPDTGSQPALPEDPEDNVDADGAVDEMPETGSADGLPDGSEEP